MLVVVLGERAHKVPPQNEGAARKASHGQSRGGGTEGTQVEIFANLAVARNSSPDEVMKIMVTNFMKGESYDIETGIV